MKPVNVRNVVIGEGIPKICVPIVSASRKDIINEAKQIRATQAEVVEWRADWYEDVMDFEKVSETLTALRDTLKELPILFTFRTKREGGEREISPEEYEQLCISVLEGKIADLIDVELFFGAELVSRITDLAHQHQVVAVVSNHDFHATPPKKEIIKRLARMIELGADIPKIAVMPQDRQDVLVLMSATLELSEQYPDVPVITMSMSQDGILSRIGGEFFGSAMTFGTLMRASAPGQIPVADLSRILKLYHKQKEGIATD